jgi:hypothetical protein
MILIKWNQNGSENRIVCRANNENLEQLDVSTLEKLEKVLLDALSITKSKKVKCSSHYNFTH